MALIPPICSRMHRFFLNRDVVETALPAGMVLLDFLRRHARLPATKEGCREGDCGACLVLLGELRPSGVVYRAVNSCLIPLAEAGGRHVVTLEGLNLSVPSPVQRAFVAEGAAQCGFCTPGFMVSLTGFLLAAPRWDTADALDAIGGNLCRCTGYAAIRRAVATICSQLRDRLPMPAPPDSTSRVKQLVEAGWLPEYLLEAAKKLGAHGSAGIAPDRSQRDAGSLFIAGGTDLYVQHGEAFEESSSLALLSREPALHGLRIADGRCFIGAATPLSTLEDSPELRAALPGWAEHFRRIASRPIRHRATLGGNLVNASPIGDPAILLLALGARLTLDDGVTRRELPLRSFFLGYKKLDLRAGELVAEISFGLPPPGAVFSFEKVGRRTHLDIAGVNSALLAIVRDGRVVSLGLSAGGVAPVPLFLAKTVGALEGSQPTPATLRAALAAADAEIAPISDVRGSADYKRLLLRRLLLAHFHKLAPTAVEEQLP